MFANFMKYFAFICRREKLSSPIWLLGIVCLAVLCASAYPGLVPDEASLAATMTMMDTPAMIAMMGNVYGLDAPTQAIAMAQECLVWFLLAIAIMNIFLVNRHTRVDEELGRQEMLIALPVGRMTGSISALAFAFALNVLIAVLIAVGVIAYSIDGTTVAGAFTYGGVIGATGFLFAALTLLAAQILSTSRGAAGIGMAALGLSYILRASGDVSDNALSLISPIGLGLKVEAFYTDDFLPIATLLAEGVVLAVGALALNAVRDHGTGIIAARKGKSHASRFLRSPFGLAWRLTRNSVIWWAVALFVVGCMYGSVASDIEDFAADNEMVSQFLEAAGGGTMTEQYIAMLFSVIGILCAVPCASSVLRLRSEESRGRLEQIFARPVKRSSMFCGFVIISFAESAVMLFAAAVGMVSVSGGLIEWGMTLQSAFAYLPALWAMTGCAALLVGVLPKLTALVWAVIGYSFVAIYLGLLLNFPEWTIQITPFGHIPQLPVDEFALAPLAVIAAIAVALTGVGAWRYADRDIVQ
jgi:ABC-2 type transport system permease protein